MKVLVTGGAGFIGSHVVDRLISLGHNVVVLDNFSRGSRANINDRASEIIEADVADIGNFEKELERTEVVIHLAAQMDLRYSLEHPEEDAQENIINSLRLISFCNKVKIKHFIFASSGSVYGHSETLPSKETDRVRPACPYACAKSSVELYLNSGLCHFSRAILRFGNVYGPRQNISGETGVVSILEDRRRNYKDFTMYGGTQTRDYVHVFDIVSAIVTAFDLSGTYNVGTGVETSLEKLVELYGIPKDRVTRKPAIKGELERNVLNADRLKSHGWRAKIALEHGITLFNS